MEIKLTLNMHTEDLDKIASYTFSIGEDGSEPLNINNPEKLKPIDFSKYA